MNSRVVVGVHPFSEPCLDQILAFLKARPTGQADGVHLVVPGGRRNGKEEL